MAGVHDVKASLCRQPVEHADHSERSDEANSTQINRGRTLRSSRSEDLPSTSARETGVRAQRSILEETLHDLLFKLPEYGQPARSFVISGEMIRSGSAKVLLEGGDEAKRESA